MDSITHIVLGACIGDAVFSRKIGKKGMLIGAIAQSFPDSDILGTLWLPLSENLNFHRGITHSFFFGFFIGLIGCYKGFNASGGTASVGHAANSAVVTASLSIFIIDMLAVQITDLFFS